VLVDEHPVIRSNVSRASTMCWFILVSVGFTTCKGLSARSSNKLLARRICCTGIGTCRPVHARRTWTSMTDLVVPAHVLLILPSDMDHHCVFCRTRRETPLAGLLTTIQSMTEVAAASENQVKMYSACLFLRLTSGGRPIGIPLLIRS